MGFRNREILVFGLKRSGRAAALALHALGAKVSVTDSKTAPELSEETKGLYKDIKLYLGGHPEEMLEGRDMIVISPGVSSDIPVISKAREMGIKVVSELELGCILMRARNPGIDFYAITGTNGKSTTTALLGQMLQKSGKKTFVAGNIGNAVTGEIDRAARAEAVVLEVSSFQLENIHVFKPRIAAILNLAPDHLDRYHSFGEYRKAKARIFANQDAGDFLVLNAGDPACLGLYREFIEDNDEAPRAVFFGRGMELFGIYEKGGVVYMNLPGICAELVRAEEIRIKGVHNLENAMAASVMAFLAGAPLGPIAETLREFPGLPHRMEIVGTVDGVTYVNDSKGTNPPATLRSIESFEGTPIVLILGGRDKNGDFQSLREAIRKNARAVIVFGEAKEKIMKAVGGAAVTVEASALADVVNRAREMAKPGDAVLFSPACASFDMFRDFEDRGERFREEVGRL
jgi:UDP-N-acetylmuramoylalanine--D-glutamate ligase